MHSLKKVLSNYFEQRIGKWRQFLQLATLTRDLEKRDTLKKQLKAQTAQVRGRQVHLLKVYVAPSYILLFHHSLVVNPFIRTIHILRQQRGGWVLKIDSLDGVQYFIYADLTP